MSKPQDPEALHPGASFAKLQNRACLHFGYVTGLAGRLHLAVRGHANAVLQSLDVASHRLPTKGFFRFWGFGSIGFKVLGFRI